jgi:hypothetical protein
MPVVAESLCDEGTTPTVSTVIANVISGELCIAGDIGKTTPAVPGYKYIFWRN